MSGRSEGSERPVCCLETLHGEVGLMAGNDLLLEAEGRRDCRTGGACCHGDTVTVQCPAAISTGRVRGSRRDGGRPEPFGMIIGHQIVGSFRMASLRTGKA